MTIFFYDPDAEFGWLANFSPHCISIGGEVWPTVEHYFQAMKFNDSKLREKIRSANTPEEAKKMAAELSKHKRSDWPRVRHLIMYNAIHSKFRQYPELATRLLATKGSELVEKCDDSYWGSGNDCQGLNRMGKLLMQLRSNLQGAEP